MVTGVRLRFFLPFLPVAGLVPAIHAFSCRRRELYLPRGWPDQVRPRGCPFWARSGDAEALVQERSTPPAVAPVMAPRSQVTAPLPIVYSTPRHGITMRLAPPVRP